MKKYIFLLIMFFVLVCKGQVAEQEVFFMTISPVIDKTENINQHIINTLSIFLKTKNLSLKENSLWLQSDFQRYIYPYLDIYNIENSRYGKNFFKPTLMEIIKTENENQRIVKIAFVGYNHKTKENQVKSIFNLVANISGNEILFSKYLDYATQHWMTLNKNSITYRISPRKDINEGEIIKQQIDIERICDFFKCKPIAITYYSCLNPKEIFEIKGFDYNPMMYVDKTGGLADFGDIIFSGNNAEIYTHEIVHIYTKKLFPELNKFLDEGIATYIAGSGKFNYEWHRKKLYKFLIENTDYDFAEHIDPYERIYFENETSIPYLTAAIIFERTLQIYGKEKLMELLKSELELWETLSLVGLTKENINDELRRQIKLPLIHPWEK